jgi:hypothetical protein
VSRRLVLIGAAALGALIPLLAVPSAASADDAGSALISLDGSSFSRAPQGGILPAGTQLVPGGTATGTFWVKNDSERTAALKISVADASSASATFLESLSLEAVTLVTPDGTPVPLSSGTACIPLLSGELLGSRQVTAVRITLAMDADASNADQGSDATAALVASLADPAVPESGADGCADGGGIPLLPEPGPEPSPEPPASETTDPTPAITAPQPTAAAGPETTDPNETGETPPAAETPPTAGALPPVPSATGLPVPLLGAAGLALGAGAFLLARMRRRRVR